MTTPTIVEFARRVERMCDFFLMKLTEETGRTGSDDQRVLEDLKEDAANLQVNPPGATDILEGLDSYMRSLPHESHPSGDREKGRS
jgi:hypothetical protein